MPGRIFKKYSMALRNQPYIPLYVDDILGDEKLVLCSHSTQGIYLRILCCLHKSDTYGSIMFKQNNKQNLSMLDYFVWVLACQTGVQEPQLRVAIDELLDQKVLRIDDNELFQKRMKQDGETSLKRSKSALLGGGNPALKTNKKDSKSLFKQKDKQNTVNVYVNENVNKDNIKGVEKFSFSEELKKLGVPENLVKEWVEVRKKKRLTNSETALKGFLREVEKTGLGINEIISECVELSWGGFNSEWTKKGKIKNQKLSMVELIEEAKRHNSKNQ